MPLNCSGSELSQQLYFMPFYLRLTNLLFPSLNLNVFLSVFEMRFLSNSILQCLFSSLESNETAVLLILEENQYP